MTKLDGIIRLRKWQLDEERRGLAALFEERVRAQDAITFLEQEMLEQSNMKDSDVSSFTLGAYLEGARKKKAWLIEAMRKKDEEIALKQDVVSEAFRELKTYEIADAAHKEKVKKEEDKLEQEELDELGLQAYERSVQTK